MTDSLSPSFTFLSARHLFLVLREFSSHVGRVRLAMADYDNPLPFSFFCDLLAAIQDIKPVRTGKKRAGDQPKESRTLENWIAKLRECHSPLPAGSGVLFFRLFFPEEGVRRRCVRDRRTCQRC